MYILVHKNAMSTVLYLYQRCKDFSYRYNEFRIDFNHYIIQGLLILH